jgi:hypothetical protein
LILVQADVSAARLYGDIGVRVGMLLGQYLDDVNPVCAVAEDVAAGWLRARDQIGGSSTVEQWWEDYVDPVEAVVGGAECATDDDLRRVWINQLAVS